MALSTDVIEPPYSVKPTPGTAPRGPTTGLNELALSSFKVRGSTRDVLE